MGFALGKEVIIFENNDRLLQYALKQFETISKKAIDERGKFCLALSGGRTPVGFYQKLSQQPLDWGKTHLFTVDERFVSWDHPDSNYGMIYHNLLRKLSISEQNCHFIVVEGSPLHETVDKYERELRSFFKLQLGQFPEFDLVILGIGVDGHLASLFPNHSALNEESRLVISVASQDVRHVRISLTLPVLNHARNIIFIVSGSHKAQILKQIFEEKLMLPAGLIQPKKGSVFFLIDKDAAAYLSEDKYQWQV